MPPEPPARSLALSDARAKLAWASGHVDRFYELWHALYDANPPISTYTRLNGKRDAFIMWVKEVPEPDPSISLAVGDAIQNFRAALDHLVWQLARLKQGRTPRNSNLAFPRACNPDHFRSEEIARRLYGVGPEHRDMIEQMQPYRQAFVGDIEHPLFRLTSMSNKDKHRRLNLVDIYCHQARLRHRGAEDCEVIDTANEAQRCFLKVDYELGRFLIRPTGDDPQIDAGVHLSLELALNEVVLVGGVLKAIEGFVAYVLRTFEPIFLAREGSTKG